MNNWYVITGGPSSGKTTLLTELEKRGYATLPEAARIIIDEAIAAGKTVEELRSDEKKFQEVVLGYKIKVESEHPAELLTFFDRGIHDTLAYLQLKALTIDANVLQAMRIARYKQVFLLDPLHNYTIDYARTETPDETITLNRLLLNAFSDYGMEPIRIPVLSPSERADFVLQHIS